MQPVANPYLGKPDHRFWRRAMSGRAADKVDPVAKTGFTIRPSDKVATAGSCFAQHIARYMQDAGYNYYVAEPAPDPGSGDAASYGVFSARYGNLYTVRQLWQLFRRAHGVFEPSIDAWQTKTGHWIDPFRPRIVSPGFATREDLLADREAHYDAVRTMFETCDVFVMTLGLTEGWVQAESGDVVPFHPGAVGAVGAAGDYRFRNFEVAEMQADLDAFIVALRVINPGCRIVLTVSPVALIATFEDDHVLSATSYSKAALRVVAETARRGHERVDYFPSYEIICGPQARGAWFEDDLREVRPEGVAYVMSIFAQHYLRESGPETAPVTRAAPSAARIEEVGRLMHVTQGVICDEVVLDLPA
jgi:hypothetical protein